MLFTMSDLESTIEPSRGESFTDPPSEVISTPFAPSSMHPFPCRSTTSVYPKSWETSKQVDEFRMRGADGGGSRENQNPCETTKGGGGGLIDCTERGTSSFPSPAETLHIRPSLPTRVEVPLTSIRRLSGDRPRMMLPGDEDSSTFDSLLSTVMLVPLTCGGIPSNPRSSDVAQVGERGIIPEREDVSPEKVESGERRIERGCSIHLEDRILTQQNRGKNGISMKFGMSAHAYRQCPFVGIPILDQPDGTHHPQVLNHERPSLFPRTDRYLAHVTEIPICTFSLRPGGCDTPEEEGNQQG